MSPQITKLGKLGKKFADHIYHHSPLFLTHWGEFMGEGAGAKKDRVACIAHRGDIQNASENTLAAFSSAIANDCQRIELDLQVSSDGKIFISHDDHLKGSEATISASTAASLRKAFKDLPILEEVLELCRGKIELNLEVKGDRPEIGIKAAAMVKDFGISDRIIYSCFYESPLKALSDRGLELAFLWARDSWRISPALTFSPLRVMQRNNFTILHPEASALSPRLMEEASSLGYEIFTWISLKEEARGKERIWNKILELGIDGHCTNFPEEFIAYLKQQNINQPKEETHV